MNKAEREQLKDNEAVDAIVSANSYLSDIWRRSAWQWPSSCSWAALRVSRLQGAPRQERAHGQPAAAIAIRAVPLRQHLPQAPALLVPGTYATEVARADAALKQLLSTADAYKGTDAGMRARYYAALAPYAETNRPKEAGDAYTVVRDQGFDAAGPDGLARAREHAGAPEAVRTGYSRCGRNSRSARDAVLPVDAVLVQLADAHPAGGLDSPRRRHRRCRARD